MDAQKFPSPIGVFLFISHAREKYIHFLAQFPSPIGVFLFIFKPGKNHIRNS